MARSLIHLALYEPDIPQNVGAAIRLCACLGIPLEIIEPCGFPWDERKVRRAALDYIVRATLSRHASWRAFRENHEGARLVLMTTKTDRSYLDFEFLPGDILIAGQESAGVPEDVHHICDARITIPLAPGMRSLNVVNAASMILGEAIRQTSD